MNPALNLESASQPSRDEDVAFEIAALAPWTQNLTLPDGTSTAPEQPAPDQPGTIWDQFRDFLPADLAGRHALDIGCNAGFYAVELARRGAHVTALESNPHFLRQAQWVIGRHALEDRVDLFRGHLYDLARWRGHHDVVLLLGQLHRLRYPMLALDIAAQLAQRCLILQVPETIPNSSGPTVWWQSTAGTVEAMINAAGFEVVARPGSDLYLCQPRKSASATPRWNDPEFAAATGTMPPGMNLYRDETAVTPASVAPLAVVSN